MISNFNEQLFLTKLKFSTCISIGKSNGCGVGADFDRCSGSITGVGTDIGAEVG